MSASSGTPAILESAAEGEHQQDGSPRDDEDSLVSRQPGVTFHCDICSIDTTSAAHLEVGLPLTCQ